MKNDISIFNFMKTAPVVLINLNYQRNYQWSGKTVKSFMDDLQKYMKDMKHYEGEKPFKIYVGPMICYERPIDVKIGKETQKVLGREVGDGQQRLVTFAMIAKVLTTLYDNELSPRWNGELKAVYRMMYGDEEFDTKIRYTSDKGAMSKPLENILNLRKNEIEKFQDGSKLGMSFKQIVKRIKNEVNHDEKYIAKLCDVMGAITVGPQECESEEELLHTFNGMNARGEKLSTLAKVKSFLWKETQKENPMWDSFVELISERDEKCDKTFLSRYFQYAEEVWIREGGILSHCEEKSRKELIEGIVNFYQLEMSLISSYHSKTE